LKYSCALCLLLLIFCTSPFVIAQSTNATISGIVVDATGKVIANADIEIVNDATGARFASKTNGDGIYAVSILPPGQYRVQVSKIGFKTLIKPGIILNVQSATALNFTLPVGAVSESVTVEAGSSMINTTDAAVSTVIDRKFVGNLPLNGRSFQDLISMTPGVVTQSPQSLSQLAGYRGDFSVNGQRTESNYYTIDGVTANTSAGYATGNAQAATGGTIAAATALGTTQSLISVDAMQEFRVTSSTYSAEFGRAPGGQFSVATRSGTNDLHGTLFEYLRNNFFDANDWFNNYFGKPISALRQNDFGGTLGGPIQLFRPSNHKNKTFFFVSYEGLRLTQPQPASLLYVPSMSLRQSAAPALQPVLNAFPIPTGAEVQVPCTGVSSGTSAPCPSGAPVGTPVLSGLSPFIHPYSLPSSVNSTSARIDQLVGSKHLVFFRVGYTPSFISTRTLSALATNQANAQSYTLGISSSLSPKLNNDFRLGYSRSSTFASYNLDNFGGASPVNLADQMGIGGFAGAFPEISIIIAGAGTSTIYTKDSQNLGRQWNATDSVSVTEGRHHLKLGIDYRRIISPTLPSSPFVFGSFSTRQAVINNTTTTGDIQKSLNSVPIFNELAAFAQDEWKINQKVSLSLGLRWDVNPPPTEQNGNDAYTLFGSVSSPASLTLAPRGTPLWRTTYYNFAPRLGIAWSVHATPGWETVLRTGGGIFFDTNNEIATQGFNNIGFRAISFTTGTALAVTSAQLAFPISTTLPCSTCVVNAFPGHLQLPYTLEWNVAMDQAMGSSQVLTLSYVGSNGRRLTEQQVLSLAALNPNFSVVYYYPGNLTSSYQALEAKFQRHAGHGVNLLTSYTWSHSIDFGSNSTALPLTRGNSDFDVRQNLQAGFSWDLPALKEKNSFVFLANDWGIDLRGLARTGFPITLGGNTLLNPATGSEYVTNVNLIPGRPLYLYGAKYPGGRALNGGPSATPMTAAIVLPAGTDPGNAPRNFARGFGESQLNLAVRKDFRFHESVRLQFRAESFNVLNHPNFGNVDSTLTDATFGQATKMLNQSLGTMSAQYQQGGSRSMQFALKFLF